MRFFKQGVKKEHGKGATLYFLFPVICLMLAFLILSGCAQAPAPIAPHPQEEASAEPVEKPVEEAVADKYIIMATTTSTYDSGLLDVLLPAFMEKYGIEVQVIFKGTGQALELGQRGDVDILLVHDRASELRLVEEGYFSDRHDVMYNDFVMVGPAADPAGVKGMAKVTDAFSAIAGGGYTFLSRGDDSGTYRRELKIWEKAGVSDFRDWYLSVGQGMGDTLRMTSEMQGYTLTDRGTYLSLKDKLDLEIVLQGDPVLFNQYGVMAVNPQKHAHVKYASTQKFIDFMMSPEGQDIIASFRIGGESLFFPGKGIKD
ncbi:MAG: substrate-binding domain-containing protein [Bacillota bacterium]